jgi:hypothetical protein
MAVTKAAPAARASKRRRVIPVMVSLQTIIMIAADFGGDFQDQA